MNVAPPLRDETRARILEVALELFAEQGFAATSTRELSERLGFTKAALYYHFRTKDDLLTALIAPALEELSNLVAEATPDPSSSTRRRVLIDYIDLVARHERLIRVLSQDPSASHRPALAASEPLYARLVQLIAGRQEPDAAERTRVRAALGGAHLALLHAAPDDDREVVRAATVLAACGALGISAADTPERSVSPLP